jgi:hypothetical protein
MAAPALARKYAMARMSTTGLLVGATHTCGTVIIVIMIVAVFPRYIIDMFSAGAVKYPRTIGIVVGNMLSPKRRKYKSPKKNSINII